MVSPLSGVCSREHAYCHSGNYSPFLQACILLITGAMIILMVWLSACRPSHVSVRRTASRWPGEGSAQSPLRAGRDASPGAGGDVRRSRRGEGSPPGTQARLCTALSCAWGHRRIQVHRQFLPCGSQAPNVCIQMFVKIIWRSDT